MLDDRLFVALARKTGYPAASDLERCRAIQLAWARDGNRVSLLEVSFAQGALDEKQFARYERWAAQIAAAEQGPLMETKAAPSERRVLHESAVELRALPPRCDKCGRDLDDLGVIDKKVHVTQDGRKVCRACWNAVPARVPSTPRVAAALPSKPGVVQRTKRLLQSSKDHLAALVRRSPRRDDEPPAPSGSWAPVVGVLGVVVVAAGAWFFTREAPSPAKRGPTPSPAKRGRDGEGARPVPGPGPVPVPVPSPSPTPTPTPSPTSTPSPSPSPSVSPPPDSTLDPDPPPPPAPSLDSNPSFRDARASYARALDLYRSSFAGKSATEKQGLRDSRKLLEKARALLEGVPRNVDDAALDDLGTKVSSLLHDVEKRQGATGS